MAAPQIEFRPATSDDRPAIDAFAAAVVAETYGRIVDDVYAESVLSTWWGSALDPDITAGRITLAVEADQVVGLAQVGDVDGTPVLWKLYVDASHRSSGIGADLVDRVIRALPADTTKLLVEHIAANVDAARFYRRHGFARTHVNPHDDIRLATVWRARAINPDTGHGHEHHHHHDDVDWSAMADHLAAWDRVLATTYDDMVGWLGVRPGAHIAEIGSGAGGFAAALAPHLSAGGQLTLVDTDDRLLDLARRRQPEGLDVVTVHADLDHRPWPDALHSGFDLVHAGNVVHHTDDQLRILRGLAELVAPGGRLVIAEGGLPTRFLPSEFGLGEPDLEARLHAATAEWFWEKIRPAGATTAVDEGWGQLLDAVGFTDIRSRSFLIDVPPPLEAEQRRLVASSLAGIAARVGNRIAPDDQAAISALVDARRSDSVHQRPDVFILGARTLHVATRPG